MSSVRWPPPGPSVSLLTTVRRGVFTPFHEESKTLALPAPTLAVTSTSTFGGTTTRRSPALSRTTMCLSCPVKSTWLRSSRALPKPCSYESASAVMLAGCQVTSPAEPRTGRACSAAVAIPSMSASTIPSAIRPRDRPNQAPSTRPTPTMARATATYPANGIVPCPITSTSPTTPRPSRIREKVTRPRREGGRTGLTGAGAVTSPGCGYGPLVYGPYGANGGWYPGVSTGPVGGAYGGGGGTGADPDRSPTLRLISRTAARIRPISRSRCSEWENSSELAPRKAAIPTITTTIGEVLDRPRPSSASAGEPAFPPAGSDSQPPRDTRTPMPPTRLRTAMSTRHSTGSVLVARPIAAHTPASTRPRPLVGRTSPYRVAQPEVPGGGGGNPPGGREPAPRGGGGGGGGGEPPGGGEAAPRGGGAGAF